MHQMRQASGSNTFEKERDPDDTSRSELSLSQLALDDVAAKLEVEVAKHRAQYELGKQMSRAQLSKLVSTGATLRFPSEPEVKAAVPSAMEARPNRGEMEELEIITRKAVVGPILEPALRGDSQAEESCMINSVAEFHNNYSSATALKPPELQRQHDSNLLSTIPQICDSPLKAHECLTSVPSNRDKQTEHTQGSGPSGSLDNQTKKQQAAIRSESIGQVFSSKDGICSDIFSASHLTQALSEVSELVENGTTVILVDRTKALDSNQRSNEQSPRSVSNTTRTVGRVSPAPSLTTKISSEIPADASASHKSLSPAQEVAILVDNMLEAPDNVELNLRALRSMRRISTNDEGRKVIGESGGVQIVADCMRRLGNNTQLATMSCMVIANLCFNSPENKLRVYKSRVIDSMVGFLASVTVSDQLAFVCLALRNISNNCRENQIFLGASGGVDGLCKVMKYHMGHLDVMIQSNAAIGNIASGNRTCQMRVRECGGLELLVQSMKTHPTAGAIHEHCMIAIENVCRGNEKNQRLIGGFGGVDQVIVAMRLFKDVKSIQIRACAVLRILAFDSQNRERLGLNGGIVCIVTALKQLSNNKEEIEGGLKALSNATYDHIENKNAVVRSGGIEAVLAILLSTGDNLDVQRECLRVFRNLTDYSAEVRSRLCRDGVLQAAINCMGRSREHPGIAEHAIAFILNLLSDVHNGDSPIPQIDKQTLTEYVQLSIDHFPQNDQIQLHGQELIAALKRLKAKDSPENNLPSMHIVDRLRSLKRKMSSSTVRQPNE
jgi:Spinocerebellar ataxia type 10 protein domain/Armadillo/beta-catenin-like repeat